MSSSPKIMAHLIAGYPNKKGFSSAVRGLADGGADILELQIPFSDPTADGPIITAACEETVKNGFKVKEIFDYIKEAQKTGFKNIFVMSYANIAFKYGINKFVKDLKNAGVSGIIIPDLPLEDEEGFYRNALENNIEPIPVVAINLSAERLTLLNPYKKIYVSLRTGTTGSKTAITKQTKEFLNKLKDYELCAGFGIQNHRQVKALAPYVDTVIAGSYFTGIIGQTKPKKIYKKVLKAAQALSGVDY